jgi:hypothetical protein
MRGMPSDRSLSELTHRYDQQQGVLDCVRWLSLKAAIRGPDDLVFDSFARAYPRSPFTLTTKVAVPAGDTVTPDWAAVLIAPPPVAPVFARIREQALPAKLGLRQVPFAAAVPVQSTWASFSWIGEGLLKPAVKWDWTSVTVPARKFSGIVPLTKELIKFGGADAVTAAALVNDAVAWQDAQFVATITATLTPITATATDLPGQVDELITALYTNRPTTQRPMLITRADVAHTLTRQSHSDRGYFGLVPLVVSEGAGSQVLAVDANGILAAEDPRGDALDVSGDATLELAAPPAGGEGAVLSSLWQQDLIAIRIERMVNWARTADSVVQILTVIP